jgi:hypothetical protein
MDNSETTITDADVDAFGHKLATWAQQLNPTERTILTAAIARGVIAEERGDVQGYGNWLRDGFYFNPAIFKFLTSPPPPPETQPDRDRGGL